MTVAAELARSSGALRRLALKIEGVKEVFFERVADPTGDDTAPTWSGRTGINCLVRPQGELASGIDLGELSTDIGNIDIQLIDVDDPIAGDGTSYFGKLFAPSRNTDNNSFPTVAPSLATTQIDANASTLHAKNTTEYGNLASSGDAFIYGERFSYTGKSTVGATNTNGYTSETLGTFTAVTKGVYPAITNPRGGTTTTFGRTYLYRNRTSEKSASVKVKRGPIISDVPYSMAGRMVALYVTAWDFDSGDWFAEADAKLLWAGTLAGGVTWSPDPAPDGGHWTLTCDGVLGMMEETVANDLPVAKVVGINLNGAINGRTAYVRADHTNSSGTVVDVAAFEYSFPARYYDKTTLASELLQAMQTAANWTSLKGTAKPAVVASVPTTPGSIYGAALDRGGQFSFEIGFPSASSGARIDVFLGAPNPKKSGPKFGSHPLVALGFNTEGQLLSGSIDSTTYLRVDAPRKAYDAYHPLNLDENNGKILVIDEPGNPLATTQGDHGTALDMAYVSADGEFVVTGGVNLEIAKKRFAIAYTSSSSSATSPDPRFPNVLEYPLAAAQYQPAINGVPPDAYAASYGPLEMKQVIVPAYKSDSQVKRGPFEQLLYLLLSTGVTDYNDSTYDKMPARYGIGFPSGIVDTQSFLDADAFATSIDPELARRRMHIIDEPTKFIDLLSQELKLFGFALTWDTAQSKIALRSIYSPNRAGSTATLSESNTSRSDDYPNVSASTDDVVNQWKIDYDWSLADKKFMRGVIVKDMEAQDGTRGNVREVKLEHRALETGLNDIKSKLEQGLFLQRMHLLRTPRLRLDRTGNATLLGTVSLGDVVTLDFDHASWDHENGDKTLDALALVVGLSWNLAEYAAALQLFVFDESYTVPPWAPAALVTAYSGSPNFRLTLSALQYGLAGESDDGSTFSAGDKVKIYERADLGASSSGPYTGTVASAYETDGAGILTLSGDTTPTGATIDPTQRDYIVTFDDYANVVTAQKTLGLWGANNSTYELASGVKAQRWG